MIGRVTSTKLSHTATVLVERVARHPLYKKTFIQSKKYLVDDAIGVKIGDMVEIIKCKPISKNKHWKITKVVGKNFVEIAKLKLKKEAEKVIAEVMPEEVVRNDQKSSEETKSGNFEKEVVVNNLTKKPKVKKGGRTELSKTK